MLKNIVQEVWQVFGNHPVLLTIIIIFLMFFITVLILGWPGFKIDVNEDAPDMDFENSGFPEPTKEPSIHEDYTVEWKQTGLELGDNGFPSTITGTFTLRRR